MKYNIAMSKFMGECEVIVSQDGSTLKQGARYSLVSEPGTDVSVNRCNLDHQLGCKFIC